MADWLSDIGGLPVGFRIYDGSVCIRNDITDELYKNPELLLKQSGEYDVCKTAAGLEVWIPVLIAVVSAVYTYVMMKNMNVSTNTGNTSQTSATNSFSDRQNEARVGQRIDDIFGTVAGHIPPLWQVPYSRYVNNVEYENFYLCIGRGKYQFNDEPRDGNTSITRIPGAKVNIFDPYTSPNSGDFPSKVWGGLISSELKTVKKSGEVDNSELLPPNDLSVENFTWTLTSIDATTVRMNISTSSSVLLTDYFSVSQTIDLYGIVYIGSPETKSYYRKSTLTPSSFSINRTLVSMSGNEYTITAVSDYYIEIDVSTSSAKQQAAFLLMSSYSPPTTVYSINDGSAGYTTSSAIDDYQWFTSSSYTTPVSYLAPIS